MKRDRPPTFAIVSLRRLELPPEFRRWGVMWEVTLDGGNVVVVKTRTLQTAGRFRRVVLEQCDRDIGPMRNRAWALAVDDALAPLREAKRKAAEQ